MTAAPILVFDGDCGFCTRSAEVAERIARDRFTVAPWQRLDLGALGLTRQECEEAVQFVRGSCPRHTHVAGHRAIAAALRAAGRPWSVIGRVLTAPGVDVVAGRVYQWAAEHRHQLPGGTPACALPANPQQPQG
ncbi:thiol-disulfide oxidoreductase DCC family protein [Flexivirga meconopsidis]|uniref:thiol-disulfide oxidoreductase DCC family protein n=1 Tax=Flexivirga meconopsidis TaxID=2977121 RepID=UPI00223F371B|nr:DCC1-like thiol-disulfide oxidoreductase family protein [Flexivirga meconopsidis]